VNETQVSQFAHGLETFLSHGAVILQVWVGQGAGMNKKAGRAGEQSDYQSYLLRLWQENSGEEGWRASLESAYSGGRRGFADLEALFDFLRRQTAQGPNAHLDEDWGGGSERGKERRWSIDSIHR
jgi:hypothetical protein